MYIISLLERSSLRAVFTDTQLTSDRNAMKPTPLINKLDKQRIIESIDASGTPPAFVTKMLERISAARAIGPTMIPPDIVTMNSIVRIVDVETDVVDVYSLVYHQDLCYQPEWVSINSKIGCQLIGRRVGEEIEIESRRGSHTIRIDSIEYQPEAAGKFDV